MGLKITIADYGVGNLHSIRKALELCGSQPHVESNMARLLEADCIVFPGVGAFSRTMEKLMPYRKELVCKLEEGAPCLGICIGAQILFERSEEGASPGLGFFRGNVIKLRCERVPHMGWNVVDTCDDIMESIENRYFYFAHSYHGQPEEDITAGETEYGIRFPSLFRKKNTVGTQFHPEKSSNSGLKFLKNFVKFAEECI